jgi:hypothetical protein
MIQNVFLFNLERTCLNQRLNFPEFSRFEIASLLNNQTTLISFRSQLKTTFNEPTVFLSLDERFAITIVNRSTRS